MRDEYRILTLTKQSQTVTIGVTAIVRALTDLHNFEVRGTPDEAGVWNMISRITLMRAYGIQYTNEDFDLLSKALKLLRHHGVDVDALATK